LTGEKKPTFGGCDEALAVWAIMANLCQLLFGVRQALVTRKHSVPPFDLRHV
jgi:hypothetical protein